MRFLTALLIGISLISAGCIFNHAEVSLSFDNRTDAPLCFYLSPQDASAGKCNQELKPMAKTRWTPGCAYGPDADEVPLTVVIQTPAGRQLYDRTEECRVWQNSDRTFIIEQRDKDFVVTDSLTETTPAQGR